MVEICFFMKILFITAEGFDTPNPNNQMAEVMINDFLNNGISVHLIQSHRKGINHDIPDSLKGRKGLEVDTIKRNVIDKSNFVRRYFNDIKYILLKIFKNKTPIVYSIYDIFPGHAYDIGVIKNKFLYNIFRLLQKPCYKIVNAITVLSDDMKDIVVKEGAISENVYVVPAWFDVNTAREVPVEQNQFIKKYNIPQNKFYVQYAGSIGYVFNYKAIIELAKRLKNDNDIVIEIIGDGPAKEQMVSEANDLHLSNIHFYPLQPVAIVPDVYSSCNVCVIPLKKGVIGNGTPSKAPILMACNRVIINAVENWSKYSQMFAKYDMGIAVDVYDYDALANAVKYLKANPGVVKRMAANAYKYGKEHFSSNRSTKLLMDILKKIC